MSDAAKRVVRDLFRRFLAQPAVMPAEWRQLAGGPDDRRTARVAADSGYRSISLKPKECFASGQHGEVRDPV